MRNLILKTKYHNIKQEGYDSKKEYGLALLLHHKQSSGEINDLKEQVPFVLQEGFKYQGASIRAIIYKADFTYVKNGIKIVHEAKGIETPVSKIKHKMFLKRYCLTNEWTYKRN